jgi:PEP-CTERM/exosortase A-associated glycosyltransferase
MSLRILHVLDHSLPLQSGYAFRTLALLREQRGFGWETFQLTTPKHYAPGPPEEDVAGFHFFRTPARTDLIGRLPVLNQAAIVWSTAARIEEIFDRVRPDILHAHSPCLNGMAAMRVGRARGIPVVYEMRASWEDAAVDHGTTRENSLRYRLSRSLETRVLRRADAITTICHGLAQDIRSRGGVPAERITVVPNAVDIENFELIQEADAELRSRLDLGEGPVLGFIGSFYGYEGLDLLIRALPEIRRAHPSTRVVLVGGGPAEQSLKQLTNELGLGEHVRFAGRVPHEQVRRYYSVIDILAYPRRSMRLTELVTPLKPLEAMSLGRLFMASDVGGHRELIPERFRGYAFKPNDPQDLARVALRLIDDRATWPSLIAAGRRHVTEQCTWKLSASRYRDVYEAVLRAGKRSAESVRAA